MNLFHRYGHPFVIFKKPVIKKFHTPLCQTQPDLFFPYKEIEMQSITPIAIFKQTTQTQNGELFEA